VILGELAMRTIAACVGIALMMLLGIPGVWPISVAFSQEKTQAKGKTFSFEVRSKPWGQVLEWLSDETGLPVVTTRKPVGTFTFVPREPKKRTLSEVIDMINETLAGQKLLLIRRDKSFNLVPTDEKIDPSLVPRVAIDDLASRGKTELVSVVVPLRKLKAADIAGDLEKLVGPFGKVTALGRLNQLVVQDQAGNLTQIYATIKGLEEKETGEARPAKPAEKRFAFELRDKLWNNVFEWLAEQTGLQVISPSLPRGTFTVISPANKTYTIPEIIDLLNDALMTQKYRLIRLEQAYYLTDVGQRLDYDVIPRIELADLDGHSNSEIVSLVVHLSSLVAVDVKDDFTKLLGPYGHVVAMPKSNGLVMRGQVGNLKYLLQTIEELEQAGKPRKP
jgi:type II secretory pathway component GspD/PulD (secretin)